MALGGASALAQTVHRAWIHPGRRVNVYSKVRYWRIRLRGLAPRNGGSHRWHQVFQGGRARRHDAKRYRDRLGQGGLVGIHNGRLQRRQDDWAFQAKQAATEIEQIDRQIASADIKVAIAEKELDNQDLQIDQSKTVDEYMRNKYTNKQLYDWQVRQVSAVYFQAYQLAYDMAKRAEKGLQHERADPTATFVQFGYWDSLKKRAASR